MKCKRARDLMGAYLYGDLAANQMKELRLHTAECADCRQDLGERGRVVSSLPNAVPELTDAEKQQILWSVKGAVKAIEPGRVRTGFRLAPVFGLAAVLIVGVAVGLLVAPRLSKPHQQMGRRDSGGPPKSTVVKVTEEAPRVGKKDQPDTAARPEDKDKIDANTVVDILRRASVVSTVTTRKKEDENRKRAQTIVPDAPAPMATSPSGTAPEPEPGTRLPRPTDLNDARTTKSDTASPR